MVVRGDKVMTLDAASNAFTEDMKQLIAAVRPGDKVYLEGIKARLANGEGPVRDLSPITLKVLP
jgi:hypothetical protein